MSKIKTMIEAVNKSEPASFKKALNEELAARLSESIKSRKAEVVSEMFGFVESSENTEEVK